MLVPPQELINYINQLYPDLNEIFLLHTSICFKLTSHKQYTPYYMTATKYHVLFYSYHQKDQQKKIKTFNLLDSQLKSTTVQSQVEIFSLTQSYQFKFLSELEIDTWSQIINLKLPLSLQIQNFGDFSDLQGLDFSLKRNEISINQGDQLSIKLDSFYNILSSQQYLRDTDINIRDWQKQLNQYLYDLSQVDHLTKFEDSFIIFQKLIINNYTHIPQETDELLRKQKLSEQFESILNIQLQQINIQSKNSVLVQIFKLIGDFQQVCKQQVKQIIDEFTLPSAEQQIYDCKQEQMNYNEYVKNLTNEQKIQLEQFMSVLGVTHGFNAYLGVTPEYQQLRQQCIINQFTQVQDKYFPDNLIETFIKQTGNICYPNQKAPIIQFVKSNIEFQLNVSNQHGELNIQRDNFQICYDDLEAMQQCNQQYQIQKQFLQDNQNFNQQLQCVINYSGFQVYCSSQIDDKNVCLLHGLNENQEFTINYEKEEIINQVQKYFNLGPKTNTNKLFCQQKSLFYQQKFDTFTDSKHFLLYLASHLKDEGLNTFSKLIIENKLDLQEQLQQIQQKHIRSDLQNVIPWCNKLSINMKLLQYDESYILKNPQELLLMDLPSLFVDKMMSNQTVMTQDQIDAMKQYAIKFKLPVKYTQMIDQQYNPDFLQDFRFSDEDVTKLENQIINHLESIKYDIENLDKSLFSEYLIYKQQQYEKQESFKICIFWSDMYRTQYLPQLILLIDQIIIQSEHLAIEIIDIFKYFQVPQHLWLFTANLSQFVEIYDIIHLYIISQCISDLLNTNLRQLQRKIQQFGVFDNLKGYSEEQLFFTVNSKQQRLDIIQNKVKNYIVDFLNQLFSVQNYSKQLWIQIQEIFTFDYVQHSYSEQYTQQVFDSEFGLEFHQQTFQLQILSPDTVFDQDMQTGKKILNNQRRLLMLHFIQQLTGIKLKDTSSYEFSTQPFEITDIIDIELISKCYNPLEQIFTKTSKLTQTCELLQQQLNHTFSLQFIQPLNDSETLPITNPRKYFITTTSQTYSQPSMYMKNLAFQILLDQNLSNHTKMIIEASQAFSYWISYKFATLEPSNSGLKNFVNYVQIAKLLASAAYKTTHIASPLASKILTDIYQLLYQVNKFTSKLTQNQLLICKQYDYDIPFCLPNNANLALQMALKSVPNYYSSASNFVIKTRILHLKNSQKVANSAENQLKILKKLTQKTPFYAEILTHSNDLNELEIAFNGLWSVLNRRKIAISKLENKLKSVAASSSQPRRTGPKKLLLVDIQGEISDKIDLLATRKMLLNVSDAAFSKELLIAFLERKIDFYANYTSLNELLLSQIYENQARLLMQSDVKNVLFEAKSAILKAVKIRANLLSRADYYTLQGVFVLGKIDALLGDFRASLSSLEFVWTNLRAVMEKYDLGLGKAHLIDEKEVQMCILKAIFSSFESEFQQRIRSIRAASTNDQNNRQELTLLFSQADVVNSISGYIFQAFQDGQFDKISFVLRFMQGSDLGTECDDIIEGSLGDNGEEVQGGLQIEEGDWI
ncbi:hypothetical protein SS50377_23077 [Spironucleus salmonicida]|uniref:Clu domain-containing protein n=1 Tax=Spironucleus salmonicida TaxID=348837 RepID=V6M318_9EUKA|nr:hypothetical protein SS50377_23077 [Spironucleus salmonicida]|eukprot:EST47654.1 Hypothetical protein SS50377_12349 [Spironucleus salmonicida]